MVSLRLQDHLVTIAKEKVSTVSTGTSAPRRIDAAVGADMAHDRAPPCPVSPAPSECAVTPGERAPRVTAWPSVAGEPGRGRWATPGVERRTCPSTFEERHQRGRRYLQIGECPRPGGHGRGRSRLGRKRPRGVPSRGRSSRVALARAFAGLRRYMGPEPPLGSTDAFMSGGGRQAPPPDPWPPSLATR